MRSAHVGRAVHDGVVAERGRERVERVLRQLDFVRPDRVHAQRVDVVDRRAETDGFSDGRGAGFELPRHVVGLEAVEADVADHLAAAEERRDRLEEFLARPQAADAGGARASCGPSIRTRRQPSAWTSVATCGADWAPSTNTTAPTAWAASVIWLDRVERAQHVRSGGDADELHAGQLRVEIGQVEVAVGGDVEVTQFHAELRGQHQPRHQHRVVLHLREQHDVAGLEVLRGPSSARTGSTLR